MNDLQRKLKKLRVGPYKYDIHFHKELSSKERDEWVDKWGLCDYNAQVIHVNKSCSDARQVVVVVHELLHALYELGGLPEDAKEEQVITTLAPLVVQAIKDNPQLVEIIRGNG